MRRNKLYTVNRWNQPAFMFDRNYNILAGGGWAGLAKANYTGKAPWGKLSPEQQQAEIESYKNSTNAFGISKADNPFSKGNLQGGLKSMVSTPIGGALVSGLAGAVGGLANSAISGGYESGAGSAISGIGSTVGSAVGSVNPVLGAAIGVGSQILGGVTNALFGEKVDEAKLKAANESMSSLRSFNGDVSSFDDIKGPEATASVAGTYKGGLFNSSAKRKQRALEEAMRDARQYAGRAITNNVSNLADDQINDALANYAAFGGFLPSNEFGGGALGIMQNDKYLDTINNRTTALAQKNNTMNAGLSMKAFGGELGTNGTDFTNGLLYIDEGGSHESNPFDGVPMGFDAEGIPNLVEEGETVYNNYVFSDRMHVPDFMLKDLGLPKSKKHISFADASKKLAKESEQRPNDPLSQAGLDASLSKLAEIQETERMRKNAKEYMEGGEFACGGKLGNKFAGPGNKPNNLKSYAYSKNWDGFKYYDPKTGEYDKGYLDFVNNINQDWLDRIFSEGQPYGSMDRYLARNKGYALTPQQASALAQDRMYSDMHKAMAAAYEDYKAGMDPKTGKVADNTVWPDESWELDPYSEGWEERRGISTAPEDEVEDVGDMTGEKEYIPRERGEQKPYATWMRYAPVVGAGAMALTDALGLTNKPDYSGLAGLEAAAEAAGYVPEVTAEPIGDYMRYTPLDRMFHTNQLLASSRATDRALLNSSSPSKAAALLANGYNTTLALGNLAREAEEYNRGIYERTKEFNRRTNMFNSQMGLEAAMANARYRQQGLSTKLSGLAQAAAMRNDIDTRAGAAKAANLSNFFTSLGNIGRENFTFNQINSDRSRRYKVKRSGQSYYDNDEEYGLGGRIKKSK